MVFELMTKSVTSQPPPNATALADVSTNIATSQPPQGATAAGVQQWVYRAEEAPNPRAEEILVRSRCLRQGPSMRIYFMLAFRRVTRAPNPVLVEVFERLRRGGFRVEMGFGEELLLEPEGLAPAHDLYVLKSHSKLWLSLAGILHGQGASLLNPYPACAVTLNKIVVLWQLRAAGLPAPRSWVTGDLAHLRARAAERPLILKPYDGMRSDGVVVVRTPAELEALPPPDRPVIAQEYLPGAGEDLKVYVIGSEVFGVRKPSALAGDRCPRRPCTVSGEVRDIALRCGRLFGLSLYGLDLVEGPDGPVVVDLNYFPSYLGVEEAAPLLAAYIADYARGPRRELAPAGAPETSEGCARNGHVSTDRVPVAQLATAQAAQGYRPADR
jgi:ribosomal protein S6--L-glutamate ligase